MKNKILPLILISLMGLLFFVGCEDDPLLSPQTTSEDAGSYGLLLLIGDKEANDVLSNPELF